MTPAALISSPFYLRRPGQLPIYFPRKVTGLTGQIVPGLNNLDRVLNAVGHGHTEHKLWVVNVIIVGGHNSRPNLSKTSDVTTKESPYMKGAQEFNEDLTNKVLMRMEYA